MTSASGVTLMELLRVGPLPLILDGNASKYCKKRTSSTEACSPPRLRWVSFRHVQIVGRSPQVETFLPVLVGLTLRNISFTVGKLQHVSKTRVEATYKKEHSE